MSSVTPCPGRGAAFFMPLRRAGTHCSPSSTISTVIDADLVIDAAHLKMLADEQKTSL
jgi:hypothetical protein